MGRNHLSISDDHHNNGRDYVDNSRSSQKQESELKKCSIFHNIQCDWCKKKKNIYKWLRDWIDDLENVRFDSILISSSSPCMFDTCHIYN